MSKQTNTVIKLLSLAAFVVLLSPSVYGTVSIRVNGEDLFGLPVFMQVDEFVSIEIYSDDTTMYQAYLYYEFDGGDLIHNAGASPTPEAGSLAYVLDRPAPDFMFEVSTFGFPPGVVSPGIHFIFEVV